MLYEHHVVEFLLRPPAAAEAPTDLAHQLVHESLEKGCRDNTTWRW